MRRSNMKILAFIVLAAIFFVACKKSETANYLTYDHFVSPKVGKFIIYKLDSTITASFGESLITKSYLIKDSIYEQFLDNENRESYKIFRYQYDSAAKVWKSINTFYMTPLSQKLEYVEDNNRYIKLINPVTENNSWQGNSYIGNDLFGISNSFSNWAFSYTNINQPAQVGDLKFDKTVTVVQYDSTDNNPFFDPKNFYQYNKSYEVYADTIGLIYKDLLSWEYQAFRDVSNCQLIKPVAGGLDTSFVDCTSINCDSLRNLPNYSVLCDTSLTKFFYNGYGIRQTIISHN